MKRGADAQLTRDGRQDDDDMDDPGTGFKKAEDNVIAGRKMRGIPKRATAGGASALASPLSAEAPKPSIGTFAGFGGTSAFGAAAEASKPTFGGMSGFSGFGAPASSTTTTTTTAAAAAKPPTTTFGGFGGFSSKPASTPSSSTPIDMGNVTSSTVSSSASASAKSFASVMSSTIPATTNGTPAASTKSEESELQYYKSLRGLNLSILSALEKAIAADPFTDLGSHLKRYQEYRATIQQDYDSAKTSTSPETTKTTDASAAAAAITMPTPPSSFGGSSFSFGGSSSSGSQATSGGSAPKTDTASKPSGFMFGGSSSASQPFAKAPETKSDSSAKPLLTPSASSSSLFGGKPAGADHDDDLAAPSGATSLFGSPANLTPTSGTPFNFSSSAFTPSSTSNPFAASKPAGGSGFSFGGSAFKAPDPSNPFGLSSSGGAPSAFSSTPAAKPDTAEKEENGADDAAGLGLAPADHDKEGAGEEDEDTTHAIKSRIYKWGKKKTEDGTEKDAWADMGYGVVRLKCHKEDGSRRMLSRNSSTGKIVINFNLYPNLDVTVKGRNVLFIGRDESGIPVRMNIKPQTDAQATELQEAIQRDVQQLKKKT